MAGLVESCMDLVVEVFLAGEKSFEIYKLFRGLVLTCSLKFFRGYLASAFQIGRSSLDLGLP